MTTTAALLAYALGVIVAPVYWLAARALWLAWRERRRLKPFEDYMRGKHERTNTNRVI